MNIILFLCLSSLDQLAHEEKGKIALGTMAADKSILMIGNAKGRKGRAREKQSISANLALGLWKHLIFLGRKFSDHILLFTMRMDNVIW